MAQVRFTPEEEAYLATLDSAIADKQKLVIIELRQAFNECLESKAGKKVLWWLLSECKVFQQTMTGNAWTNFNDGKRSVGLTLMREIIAADPVKWIEMQHDNLDNIERALSSKEK